MPDRYVGIDVQEKRPCSFAVLDSASCVVESGWLSAPHKELQEVLERHPGAAVGIDSPRAPLLAPRAWYWRADKWRRRVPSDKGMGRHCEVVIRAYRLANPQWTPLRGTEPNWMKVGFSIFEALSGHRDVFEVFPSASYRSLEGVTTVSVRLSFDQFVPGPKDMLDAIVAATTVAEFIGGRGCAVGGGDGLGEIVLPRPLSGPSRDVLCWPGEHR